MFLFLKQLAAPKMPHDNRECKKQHASAEIEKEQETLARLCSRQRNKEE